MQQGGGATNGQPWSTNSRWRSRFELGLNGLHVEKGTPKLDQVLTVSRGDDFKLAFCFALQHREDRFTELDVGFDFALKGTAKRDPSGSESRPRFGQWVELAGPWKSAVNIRQSCRWDIMAAPLLAPSDRLVRR